MSDPRVTRLERLDDRLRLGVGALERRLAGIEQGIWQEQGLGIGGRFYAPTAYVQVRLCDYPYAFYEGLLVLATDGTGLLVGSGLTTNDHAQAFVSVVYPGTYTLTAKAPNSRFADTSISLDLPAATPVTPYVTGEIKVAAAPGYACGASGCPDPVAKTLNATSSILGAMTFTWAATPPAPFTGTGGGWYCLYGLVDFAGATYPSAPVPFPAGCAAKTGANKPWLAYQYFPLTGMSQRYSVDPATLDNCPGPGGSPADYTITPSPQLYYPSSGGTCPAAGFSDTVSCGAGNNVFWNGANETVTFTE